MRSRDMTDDEIVRRGQDIYDRKLKPMLEPAENGRYVVISVESDDYVVADTPTEAGAVMRHRHPDEVFYEARVGFPFATSWVNGVTSLWSARGCSGATNSL